MGTKFKSFKTPVVNDLNCVFEIFTSAKLWLCAPTSPFISTSYGVDYGDYYINKLTSKLRCVKLVYIQPQLVAFALKT